MVDVYDESDLARAKKLAISCDPIPYRMSWEISRSGIDCSGIMSLLTNSLRGLANPWVRLFATGTIDRKVRDGSLPFINLGMGDSDDFNMGVIFPWETSSGIGHMAGTLSGFNVEARGGYGVLLGSKARSATNPLFRHHYHMKIRRASFPPWPGRYLKLGMTGTDVKAWQAQLHKRGWTISVDGTFGKQTDSVTRAFQKEKRLVVDGVVGPVTWKTGFTAPIT